MGYVLKKRVWGGGKTREVCTSISFVFCISEFHYLAGCFPVSAFSVSAKADVAAAGAITLICSTVKKKKQLFFLSLSKKVSHAALVWACQQERCDREVKLVLQRE